MQITVSIGILVVFLFGEGYGLYLDRSRRLNVRRINNEIEPSPKLTHCMSAFMGTVYQLRCMISTQHIHATWIKDGQVLPPGNANDTSIKYEYRKDADYGYRFLILLIHNITSADVGHYELIAENEHGVTRKYFVITPVEACDTLMRCFENTCMWPDKMTCNSRPGARCVVDMCSTEASEWCMPKWFEGVEEVNCEEEDSFYDNDAQLMP